MSSLDTTTLFWQTLLNYYDSKGIPSMNPQTTQLYTPRLQLSGLVVSTGETLRFALRGETITEMLEDYGLEEIVYQLLKPWQATFTDNAEVWTIYAGPYIERGEILAILENCKTLEK